MVNDSDEKLLADETLKKSEAALRTIFNKTNTSYLLLDKEFNIVSFNNEVLYALEPEYRKMLQVGSHFFSIVNETRHERARKVFEKALKGEYLSYERDYSIAGVNSLWFNERISPIFDENDSVVGIVLTSEDISERKIAENKLLQNEQHLLATQRISKTGSWELSIEMDKDDPVLKAVYWSDQACRIFGYEPGKYEFTSEVFFKFVKPDDSTLLRRKLIEAIKEKKIYEHEFEIIRTNGEECFVKSRAEIIYDQATGVPLKVMGTIQDITERKKSKEELTKSESNLRTVFDNTDTAFVLMDNDFRVIHFSNPAKQSFWDQLRVRLSAGDNVLDYFEGERKERLISNLNRQLNGEKVRYETTFVDADGITHWYLDKFFTVKDPEDKVLGIVMSKTEITERKLLEIEKDKISTQLSNSEANLRTIFDHTSISYVLLDSDLNIISFNALADQGFINDVGMPMIAGKAMLDYFPGERKSEAKNLFLKALKGEHIKYETDYTGLDRNLSWYYFQLSPIVNSDHTIQGILMSITNITGRKTIEIERDNLLEDITLRNKDLEQFAYIVSHNLRGSVANILGTTNILEDDELEDEEKKFVLAGLNTSAKKLEVVINDLSSIVQVKQLVNEKKQKVVFAELVSDIVSTLPAAMYNDEVKIVTDFSMVGEMLSVKSYLHSIFYNLISNSIKYKKTNEPVQIEISSALTNTTLRLIFKDNGSGLDLEKIGDKAFGLYKRFHADIEGKGMGLFMVKTQVETLGGNIKLNSEPGKGCEFIIDFKI